MNYSIESDYAMLISNMSRHTSWTGQACNEPTEGVMQTRECLDIRQGSEGLRLERTWCDLVFEFENSTLSVDLEIDDTFKGA